MIKSRPNFSLIALLILFITGRISAQNIDHTPTLLIDSERLAITKVQLEKGDPSLQAAFNQLMIDADKALRKGPFSVTDKTQLPPSGNKNDYASYSRYWWPDPAKADGLPYIRRDGETYPGSQSLTTSDRRRIGAFGENTEALGLAYYFTGKVKYATKVAQLLRVWFLNKATRMNPNLNHAPCCPCASTRTIHGRQSGSRCTRC